MTVEGRDYASASSSPRDLPVARPVATWRPLAVPGLIFAALLALLYCNPVAYLVQQWWTDGNYSHGFLVPIVSGYLLWQRRKALATAPVREHWIGWPVLLLGVFCLLLGDVGAENFLLRSSLIIIVAGLVLIHVGTTAFRLVAFPLAYLFFMIPLPATVFYKLALPLQRLAALNSAWMLDVLGVPVLLDGNVIHLSSVTLGIAEACSGIRLLITLLALAVAWAYLTLPSLTAMVVFVASSVPITIVANAARVAITGLLAQSFGAQYAEGFFHTFSGWLVFVAAFCALMACARLLARVQPRRPALAVSAS